MKSRIRRYWPILLALGAVALALAFVLIGKWAEQESLQESYPANNYTLIEDDLYLGGMLSAPPPGTLAVLNVCETQDCYRVESQHWSPIADMPPAPDIDWLRAQVRFVAEQRQAGRPLLIHCRAGVSRSAMVLAAYLMWRDGCSRDEALAAIRRKRPRVGPIPAFMELLREWEREVLKPKTERGGR